MHHSSAVLGDEQVFDVELDRHTELLLPREDIKMPSWNDDQAPEVPADASSDAHAEVSQAEPGMFEAIIWHVRCLWRAHGRRSAYHQVESFIAAVPHDHERYRFR